MPGPGKAIHYGEPTLAIRFRNGDPPTSLPQGFWDDQPLCCHHVIQRFPVTLLRGHVSSGSGRDLSNSLFLVGYMNHEDGGSQCTAPPNEHFPMFYHSVALVCNYAATYGVDRYFRLSVDLTPETIMEALWVNYLQRP